MAVPVLEITAVAMLVGAGVLVGVETAVGLNLGGK